MSRIGSGPADDAVLVERARSGDREAFVILVKRHHGAAVRTALCYTPSRTVAEALCRDAWRTLLGEPARAAGASAPKARLSRIVSDEASSRTRPGNRVGTRIAAGPDTSLAVEPGRFFPPDHRLAGHWAVPPVAFPVQDPERPRQDALACLQRAVDALDHRTRLVVTLRDIFGWSTDEVSQATGLSATDQRAVLHRGRARMRAALEDHYRDVGVGV